MSRYLPVFAFSVILFCFEAAAAEINYLVPKSISILMEISGQDSPVHRKAFIELVGSSDLDLALRADYPEIEMYRIWSIGAGQGYLFEVRVVRNELHLSRSDMTGREVIYQNSRVKDRSVIEKIVRDLRSLVMKPLPILLEDTGVYMSESTPKVIVGVQMGTPVWAIRKRNWNSDEIFREYLEVVRTLRNQKWTTVTGVQREKLPVKVPNVK